MESIDREDLNQWQKFQGFKKAFETLNYHIERKNYIAAYVIAFSVLEDRINAIYYTRELIDKRKKSKKHIPFATKVKFICNSNDINSDIKDKWLKEAKIRNQKVHQAMWNIDVFKKEDCERVISYAREADKFRAGQKSAYRM